MRSLPPLDTHAQSLAFHPQSGALATASWNALYFWDPVSGQQTRHAWLALDRSNTTPLAFSPDGRWALLDYHLIDVNELVGEEAFPRRPPSPADIIPRHGAGGAVFPALPGRRPPAGNVFLRRYPLDGIDRSAHLAFSGDGRRLIAVAPQCVQTWEMPGVRGIERTHFRLARRVSGGGPDPSLATSPADCRSLALTPDGRFFAAVIGPAGTVVLWEVDGGRAIRVLSHPTTTHRVLFSPDGRFLAVGEGGARVQIWDASHLDEPGSVEQVTRLTTEYQPRRGAVRALAFSPDGRFLAAGNDSGAVHVWEAGTWREVAALDWQVGVVRSLAFSPDGMTAACAGDAGRVVLWDVDL